MTVAASSSHHSDCHKNNLEVLLSGVNTLHELSINEGKLSKREGGSYFYIDITYWTGYWAGDTPKIKTAILEMLLDIDRNRGEKKYSQYSDGRKLRDADIKALIIDKFLPAGESYFSPYSLWRRKNIHAILLPSLGALRKQKQDYIDTELEKQKILRNDKDPFYASKLMRIKEEYYKKFPSHKMDIAIDKAELMFLLKIGMNCNAKGATRSMVISWFGKKNIGIFKPECDSQVSFDAAINFFKHMAGFQVSHFKDALNAQPKAEVAAHIIAEHFNIHITCPTRYVKLGISKGSFQLWAQGMIEIQDIYNRLETNPDFKQSEIYFFQLMAVLDYLLGNLDCHGGNCLIREGKDVLIEDLRKIDNANTFITRNTTRKTFTDSKQYAWNSLRIAEEAFCPEVKEVMRSITAEEIEVAIEKICSELPLYLNNDMMSHLRQRAKVLRYAARKEHYSPSMLGQLQTDEEIRDFLKHSEQHYVHVVKHEDPQFILDYNGCNFSTSAPASLSSNHPKQEPLKRNSDCDFSYSPPAFSSSYRGKQEESESDTDSYSESEEEL